MKTGAKTDGKIKNAKKLKQKLKNGGQKIENRKLRDGENPKNAK